MSEPDDLPSDKSEDERQRDGLEHVSDLLIELWKDYKSSHLPNLLYSVAFVGGVLTLGNTSELFKRVSVDGRELVTLAVFICISSAGLAMMHRFTSQLFMEIETLPADKAMRNYYRVRNSTYKKITFSYGYSISVIELFKFIHTLTKYLTGIFLYVAWTLFGLTLVQAFLRPDDCVRGQRSLPEGKFQNCAWSQTDYAGFVSWLVKWLANDFSFGWVFISIFVVTNVGVSLSLRQPNAFRPRGDHLGPIGWPITLFSAFAIIALGFSYWKEIDFLGFSVYKSSIAAMVTIGLATCATLLGAALILRRAGRINPELGDHRKLTGTSVGK